MARTTKAKARPKPTRKPAPKKSRTKIEKPARRKGRKEVPGAGIESTEIESSGAEHIVQREPEPKPAPRIAVNANLFRIVAMCVDRDIERLSGVYCEPHRKGGVNLVGTNGISMVHIHDPAGIADRAATIRLTKPMLKACVPEKGGLPAILHVDLSTGHCEVRVPEQGDDAAVVRLVAHETLGEVHDRFPDYRRVVPLDTHKQPLAAAGFDAGLLGMFGKIGGALGSSCMVVHATSASGPALVLWDNVTNAYGVLMPRRLYPVTVGKVVYNSLTGKLPAFFEPPRGKKRGPVVLVEPANVSRETSKAKHPNGPNQKAPRKRIEDMTLEEIRTRKFEVEAELAKLKG